jgi:LPXTG-site transpeptidase (sortase) family protein
MPLRASRLAALALALGFLVGTSPTDQEPEVPDFTPAASHIYVGDEAPAYRVPYADSPQPVHLQIPSLDISGHVQPVGMTDAVTMQVPSDIKVVGWFDRSVFPISDNGHTVLVGHRDGARNPNGVFRNLENVREGDVVKVRDQSGRLVDYEVTTVELVSDKAFAEKAPWVFRVNGAHRLVLITCGGTYDRTRGGYQANVVVTAKRT